ncbi:hypothetical protein WJX72_007128 [[Myrmecia] bisecta]|uniref:Structural maintenance of chromosomes protein 6 n=1 Tax=[Myrmecia] bisecta TaxID=41462 RepID=A0AAW1Q4G9_9CHLO
MPASKASAPELTDALAYKSRTVKKSFGGEPFIGEVVSVRRTAQYGLLFKLRYTDGDGEEVDWSELQQILVPSAESAAESAAGRMWSPKRPAAAKITHRGRAVKKPRCYEEAENPAPSNAEEEAEAMEMEEEVAAVRDWVRPPGTGLPGHLKTVRLENFMCHEHLEVEFNDHVTFISGTNGSGKSAVLQAIQQALGVRAADTGRGTKQRAFIKEGCQQAAVTVKLWNPATHPDAYQPAKFGNFIIVEKRFGKTTSWAVRNEHGKKIYDKKSDLDDMLSALNINGSNPIAVMTQDTTRSFLSGSSEKSAKLMFQIYMEATLLVRILEEHEMAHLSVLDQQAITEHAKTKYKELQAEVATLKQQVDALAAVDELKEELHHLECTFAWTHVATVSEKVAKIEGLLGGTGPEKLQEADAELEAAKQEVAELQRESAKHHESLKNFNATMEMMASESAALQSQHKAAKTAAARAQQAVARKLKELSEHKQRQQALVATANESHAEIIAQSQAVVDDYQRAIAEQETQVDQLGAELLEKQQAFQGAQEEAKKAGQKLTSATQRIQMADEKVSDLMQQLQQQQRALQDKLMVFGAHAAQLVKAIGGSAAQFHRLPIGPVGSQLALKDSRWAKVVEICIGRQLETFLVHDRHDSEKLRALAQRFRLPMPAITIINFDIPPHTMPPNKLPDGRFTTVLSVLSCTHKTQAHTIMNYLIDNGAVERTVLCVHDHEAIQAGFHSNNVQNAYTLEGSRRYRKYNTQTCLPPPRNMRPPRLGASAESNIQELTELIEVAKAEADAARRDKGAANFEHDQARKKFLACKAAVVGARNNKNAVQSQLEDLMSQPPPETQVGKNEDESASGLEGELAELDRLLWEVNRDLLEAKQALSTAQAAEQAAHQAFKAKQQESEELSEQNARYMSQLSAQRRRVGEARGRVDQLDLHKHTVQAKLKDLEDDLEQMLADKAEVTASAEMFCSAEEVAQHRKAVEALWLSKGVKEEDLPQHMATQKLARRVAFVKTKMAKHEKDNGGKRDEVMTKYQAKELERAASQKRLQALVLIYNAVVDGMEMRKKQYKTIDKNVEQMVNVRFNNLVAKKGHTGMIRLDREAKSLIIEMKIAGKAAKETETVKDLKQLSGGERSFTTVALALALGGFTNNPFRAMDEFDVFMDAVNRQVSMQSLFQTAIDMPELQFIFLTPQDVGAVEDAKKHLRARGTQIDDKFVKVITMAPARPTAIRA